MQQRVAPREKLPKRFVLLWTRRVVAVVDMQRERRSHKLAQSAFEGELFVPDGIESCGAGGEREGGRGAEGEVGGEGGNG